MAMDGQNQKRQKLFFLLFWPKRVKRHKTQCFAILRGLSGDAIYLRPPIVCVFFVVMGKMMINHDKFLGFKIPQFQTKPQFQVGIAWVP